MYGKSSRSTQKFLILLLVLSFKIYGLHLVFLSRCVDSISDDKNALLSIKSRINADPLGLLSDWKNGTDPCQWKGVRCDISGRVISLNITSSLLGLANNDYGNENKHFTFTYKQNLKNILPLSHVIIIDFG